MFFMVSFFIVIGIVGSVENGAPLSYMLWAYLILAIDVVVMYRKETGNGNKNQHKQRRIQGTKRVSRSRSRHMGDRKGA